MAHTEKTEWGNTQEKLDQHMRNALLKAIREQVRQGGEAGTREALALIFQPKMGQAEAEALADDLMEQAR